MLADQSGKRNFYTVLSDGKSSILRYVPGFWWSYLDRNPSMIPLKIVLLLRVNEKYDQKRQERMRRKEVIWICLIFILTTSALDPVSVQLLRWFAGVWDSKHSHLPQKQTALSSFPLKHPRTTGAVIMNQHSFCWPQYNVDWLFINSGRAKNL